MEVRRKGLKSMRRLLPRMQLAGYASSILHPLIRVIDSPSEDLRRDALDTVCSLALALGPDLAIFSTTIQKVNLKCLSHCSMISCTKASLSMYLLGKGLRLKWLIAVPVLPFLSDTEHMAASATRERLKAKRCPHVQRRQ